MSTDPVVATIFATECSNHGAGVVHIAATQDLMGVRIIAGNVLAELECEVGAELQPAEFARPAAQTITAEQARAILRGMGVTIPSTIRSPQVLAPSESGTGAAVRRCGSSHRGEVMMDGAEAFQIAQIEGIEGGLIAVSGRAYRDLRIGDVLKDRGPRLTEGKRAAEFEIVGISTYGRTVQSLGRMLTGVLVLRGSDGGAPRTEMLHMKEQGARGTAAAHRGHRGAGEQR